MRESEEEEDADQSSEKKSKNNYRVHPYNKPKKKSAAKEWEEKYNEIKTRCSAQAVEITYLKKILADQETKFKEDMKEIRDLLQNERKYSQAVLSQANIDKENLIDQQQKTIKSGVQSVVDLSQNALKLAEKTVHSQYVQSIAMLKGHDLVPVDFISTDIVTDPNSRTRFGHQVAEFLNKKKPTMEKCKQTIQELDEIVQTAKEEKKKEQDEKKVTMLETAITAAQIEKSVLEQGLQKMNDSPSHPSPNSSSTSSDSKPETSKDDKKQDGKDAKEPKKKIIKLK